MASDLSFAEYICEQGRIGNRLRLAKMFGEFALYCDDAGADKVVILICGNQCFIKPTPEGEVLLAEHLGSNVSTLIKAPPYPSAKPHFHIDSLLDDAQFLSRLIRVTAQALPLPKPKKPNKPKGGC